ncbi:CapA family protein [Niallia sp.]|uniref:CapA family protein n=1 Tax=Niallia sp. TaxID=2837523 RepID=UPI002899EB19|nr:CapA family protein [Niallia sp.]
MKKTLVKYFGLLLIFAGIAGSILVYLINLDFSSSLVRPISGREIRDLSKEVNTKITIAAIGDILIHDRVYNDARQGDYYNFDNMLNSISTELKKPDLLLANQETIVAGESFGLSGYPTFNSPHEIADSVKKAGVDIVTTANNHALDRGLQAQKLSINYLNQIDLPHVGTYLTKEDQNQLAIIEKKGIKVAYLAYTYGLNGISIPTGSEYIVNVIDKNRISKEIQRAKKEADVIVMAIHWGNEYERFPSNEQKELAQFLIDEGVHIIFGSHPHVLQPIEWLQGKNGQQGLVVYSLGNFLSGQDEEYRDIGGMVTVTVIKEQRGKNSTITMENPSFYPTFVSSNEESDYKMHPLLDSQEAVNKYGPSIYTEIMDHMLKDGQAE